MLENLQLNQVVTVSPVFEAEVNLRHDFWDKARSLDKVKGYVPTRASVSALEAIRKGIAGGMERVHLITGARGTGKSHFGLVVGKFFALPLDNPDVQSFIQKIAERERQCADAVRRTREAVKPFLTVIPDYNDSDFNHAMNRALHQALRVGGLSIVPKTHFATAKEVLETWEGLDDHRALLGKALDDEGVSLERLKEQLDAHQEPGLQHFEKIHTSVAGGVRFAPEFQSRAEDVFQDVIRQLRDQYQGIIILYDEFQQILDSLAKGGGAAPELPVQSFFEWCKRSGQNQCHFIAIAHRSFWDYAKPDARDQAEKLLGRFSGKCEYHMTNISEGHEIEEMIDRIVICQRDHPAWKEISAHGDANIIVDELRSRRLYEDRDSNWLRKTLVEGSFPLHAAALYVLLRLSEVAAQSHRTVFRFFSFAEDGGLKHFVDTNYVLEGKRLNFYTVDHLFQYFKEDMETHRGSGRRAMEGYRLAASNRDVQESLLAMRIIKAMAVLQTIADQSRIGTSADDLAFCLNIAVSEREKFDRLLGKLERLGLFKTATGDYRFQRATGIEPRELMEKRREDLRNSFRLTQSLQQILEDKTIEAPGYNSEHATNRRMPVGYASMEELEHPEAFVNRIKRSLFVPYEGDGMFVRVCPETPGQVSRCRELLKSEKWNHPLLVLAVPEVEMGFAEKVLEQLAWESVLAELARGEDREQLAEEIRKGKQELRAQIEDYFSEVSTFIWMGQPVEGLEPQQIVDRAFQKMFPKTPVVADKVLAEHMSGKDSQKSHRIKLVTYLIDKKGDVEVKIKGGDAKDRMMRYLFGRNRMLQEVSAGRHRVTPPPPEVEIHEAWNVLDQIMKQNDVRVQDVVERMCLGEHGLTLQTLDLLLGAYFCDKSDQCYLVRRPEDWLRTKKPSLILQIDGQSLYEAVRRPGDDYTFAFVEVTKDQRWFLESVKELFAPGWEPETTTPIWQEAYEAVFLRWFNRVPKLARALVQEEEVVGFLRQLESMASEAEQNIVQKARAAFLRGIPAAFGHLEGFIDTRENGEVLLRELERAKTRTDDFRLVFGDSLMEHVGRLFDCDSSLDEDIHERIKSWWNSLPEHSRVGLEKDEVAFKDATNSEGAPRERYLCILPAEWGMGEYLGWDRDKSGEFLTKLELVKTKLEGRESPPEEPPSEPLSLEVVKAELHKTILSLKRRGANPETIRSALRGLAEDQS